MDTLRSDRRSYDRELGGLEARVTNVEGWAKSIDKKLDAIITGGVLQLLMWGGFLAWYAIQHRP